jgi:hypothetical protein
MLTQQLKMFDVEDKKNWQILAYSVSLMVSDTLSVLLVSPNELKENFYEKNANSSVIYPPV